jgi:hypothetical protein
VRCADEVGLVSRRFFAGRDREQSAAGPHVLYLTYAGFRRQRYRGARIFSVAPEKGLFI